MHFTPETSHVTESDVPEAPLDKGVAGGLEQINYLIRVVHGSIRIHLNYLEN